MNPHHFISHHHYLLTEGDRGERVEDPLELVLFLAEVDAAEEGAQAHEGVARVRVAVRGQRAQLDGEREGVQLARLRDGQREQRTLASKAQSSECSGFFGSPLVAQFLALRQQPALFEAVADTSGEADDFLLPLDIACGTWKQDWRIPATSNTARVSSMALAPSVASAADNNCRRQQRGGGASFELTERMAQYLGLLQ